MIYLFVAGTILLFLSGGVALLTVRRSHGGEYLALALVLAGCLAGTTATVAALATHTPLQLELPWPLPGGAFALLLDPVAAAFLLPVYLIVALAAIYGIGYWPHVRHPYNGPRLRLFFGTIAAALTLVLTARNGVLFLASWEVMAISGYFLITTENRVEETRRAGFLYLVLTHTGTLALFALFILLQHQTGSLIFPATATLAAGGTATAIFLLALFGFGIKAGLMPLHLWLPGAHAAAPSHISALLSGVMIKSGIYGLVRITGFYADIPLWWGGTILALGVISGVLGVVFALAQHDLKRLLAYHSVENIGIIAIGLGLALLGRATGRPELVALGLAGALLHVINHGLFKSLLFFGAGAVIHATATRELDQYGGLLRKMPVTAYCFLGGAVAICGLPPLNGFVSEWFIYLGLFRSLESAELPLRLATLAAPALALIGGLALACFVKVFGVTFLGLGRSAAVEDAHEAPPSMQLPMVVLLAVCLVVGVVPLCVAPLLDQAVANWRGVEAVGPSLTAELAPVRWLSLMALVLLALLVLLYRWQRRRAPAGEGTVPTWGCGFVRPTPRMQYTASSFADMLTGLFDWALRREQHLPRLEGPFPPPATFASHTPDTVLDRLTLPVSRQISLFATRLRARMQHGVSGLYLLNVALTLCALLAAVAIWGGHP